MERLISCARLEDFFFSFLTGCRLIVWEYYDYLYGLAREVEYSCRNTKPAGFESGGLFFGCAVNYFDRKLTRLTRRGTMRCPCGGR